MSAFGGFWVLVCVCVFVCACVCFCVCLCVSLRVFVFFYVSLCVFLWMDDWGSEGLVDGINRGVRIVSLCLDLRKHALCSL